MWHKAGSRRGKHESGITLLLAILVLLALTFAGMGLLYFVRDDAEVSSNVAMQAAVLQASDVGLEQANAALQGLSNFPEVINMSPYPWWDANNLVTGTTTVQPVNPAISNPSFWTQCASLSPPQCSVVQPSTEFPSSLLSFAGRNLIIEYVVEPTGLPAQVLNGYESLSNGAVTYKFYTAFVNVQIQNAGTTSPAGNLNANVEATLRKES